jgi:polysaccharide export outer membrane protein
MRFWQILAAGLIVFSSCVSNKRVTMLQKNDVNVKGSSLKKDTVVREYSVDIFQYKVQPNDLLSVEFESLTAEEFDFLRKQQAQGNNFNVGQSNALLIGELVDETGTITFPVLGKVQVGGLTIFQIQEKLETIANQYVQSPVVKVRLLNYRITILGEVNKEGSITLSNNRVTMLEAIGLAGGLGELADRTKVKLIRQKGAETEVIYLDLASENFLNSPYYYVYQNDVLIVPPLSQRPFRKYFGQNLSLFVSTVSVILLTITLLEK